MASSPTDLPLAQRRYLVTGIADGSSLATFVARELVAQGATVLCSGLGPTPHHEGLSERARQHLAESFESFQKAVADHVGTGAETIACDLTQDESIRSLADRITSSGQPIDGFVHAVARDKTIRRDGARPVLETTRDEFLDCMDVSAYTLIALARELLAARALAEGAGIVSLSYIGAERVVSHPYKNVAIAKAALERITVELAHELGLAHGIRVNAVRYSPYASSRAGGAIPGLIEAEAASERLSPLGNATPDSLAREVAHLLRPENRITGEIRHVDGGFHILSHAG